MLWMDVDGRLACHLHVPHVPYEYGHWQALQPGELSELLARGVRVCCDSCQEQHKETKWTFENSQDSAA